MYAITLNHSRTSFDRNRWQLSRVIFTACFPFNPDAHSHFLLMFANT